MAATEDPIFIVRFRSSEANPHAQRQQNHDSTCFELIHAKKNCGSNRPNRTKELKKALHHIRSNNLTKRNSFFLPLSSRAHSPTPRCVQQINQLIYLNCCLWFGFFFFFVEKTYFLLSVNVHHTIIVSVSRLLSFFLGSFSRSPLRRTIHWIYIYCNNRSLARNDSQWNRF